MQDGQHRLTKPTTTPIQGPPMALLSAPAHRTLSAIALALAILLGPTGRPVRAAEAPAPAALVNGQPISERMIKHMLRHFRADVIREFAPPTLGPEFWNTPVRGRVPREVLKNRALAECIRVEVQLQWASQNNLLDHPTFDALMDELPLENARRAEALKANQVVHGPIQFTEDTYFAHRFSNLQIRLKEVLGKRELAPSQLDIKQAYDREMASPQRPDAITVLRIFVPSSPPRKTAEATLQNIQKDLKAGAPFEEVARRYNPEGFSMEFSIGASRSRKSSPLDPALVREARRLKAGQTSEVFEAGDGFNVLKCASRTSPPRKSLEEIQPGLQLKLIDQRYKALLEQRIRKAAVRKNQRALNAVPVE